MKKLIPLLLVVVLLWGTETGTVSAQDSTENWYVSGQGGVFSTWSKLKVGEVYGTGILEVTRMIFGDNLALRADIQKIDGPPGEWVDFQGTTVFYTRNPRLHKFQPYLFTGGGLSHSGESEEDLNSAWNIGFGLLIPVHLFGADFDVPIELRAKGIDQDSFLMLSCGMQMPLKFKR